MHRIAVPLHGEMHQSWEGCDVGGWPSVSSGQGGMEAARTVFTGFRPSL